MAFGEFLFPITMPVGVILNLYFLHYQAYFFFL
jgi:hypothetical protein